MTPDGRTKRDVERIAQRAAAIVLQRIASAISTESTIYTSRKGHGPPGASEERWKVIAPSIPGAHKPGRWWVVSRVAYEAWAVAGTPTPAPESTEGKPWDPKSVLDQLGLRPTR